MSTQSNDLTDGPLVRPMLRLAWPMVVIQLLQVAYNVADTFWLGRLSPDAVAAMSIAFPIIFMFISIGGGLTAAGAILVAQYTGADSDGDAGLVAGQTLSFVTGLSVVLGVLGFLATGPALSLLPADPATAQQVLPKAGAYMRLFFLGMPFLFGFFVFVSLMRGYGDTRTPMRVMAVSVAVNVVLDPVLIFGWGPFPHMGIEGAAVATVTARAVAAAIGLYVLFGTSAGPSIVRDHIRPRWTWVKRIVSVGAPTAAEQSMSSIAMVSLTALVSTFPPAVVAAYGLGGRLISLVFLPAMGLGQATDTIVGQNLGAGKADRAERATYIAAAMAASVLAVAAVVAFAFPDPIVGVFISADAPNTADTIAYGSEYLRTTALMFAFMGALQVFLGAFRGAGNTKTALVFAAVTLWLTRVPLTYLLVEGLHWGPAGIWWAHAAGDVVGCLAAAAWFTRGTWKSAIVDGDDGDADTPSPGPGETPGTVPADSD